MYYKIRTVGDSALLVELTQEISPKVNRQIKAILSLIEERPIEGVSDIVPGFSSLLIHYDARKLSYQSMFEALQSRLSAENTVADDQRRIIEIPVCYGGLYGPDLDFVAAQAGMTAEEVIKCHTDRDYLIYMLGFLPGFPYLGGLDERLHTPRLANPRLSIEAGSVGIGGSQTGIYPLKSPGGWQLIGRTPVKTYDPERKQPILFEAGDYIRFKAVDETAYQKISQTVSAGRYRIRILREEGMRHGD